MELTRFNAVPHLIAPAVVDTEKVIVALRWVMREMEQRYEQFAKAGARNLESYNRSLTGKGLDPLPMIAVVIDELADVMLAAPDEVERVLVARPDARPRGHLVVATQRPSVTWSPALSRRTFPRASPLPSPPRWIRASSSTRRGGLLGRGIRSLCPRLLNSSASRGWVSEGARRPGDLLRTAGAPASTRRRRPLGMALRRRTPPGGRRPGPPARAASASFLQRQMRIGYPRRAPHRRTEKMGRGPGESGAAPARSS